MSGSFSYGRIFLLGLGFFGISLVWSTYNSYVPVFLKEFGLASATVGLIMTLDNVFAVTLQPYIGFLSDKTRTRLGRRKPYILAAAPAAALFYALIPLSQSLPLMVAAIVAMNIAMAVHRTPTIALMPDITPSEHLSKANGVINFMGGLGALLAFFGGALLYDIDRALPFLLAATLLLASSLLIVALIEEPQAPPTGSGDRGALREMLATLRQVFSDPDPSTRGILLAIFAWFFAYGAIEAFFTSYGKWHLGIKESTASMILGLFALTFILFSIPSGFIASRIGRKKAILAGLLGLTILLAIPPLTDDITLVAAAMLLGGLMWALVNVNSLPIVVDLAPPGAAGGYTGLYYLFEMAALILSPPLAGLLIDTLGYPSIFAWATAWTAIAALLTATIKREKRGEPQVQPGQPTR